MSKFEIRDAVRAEVNSVNAGIAKIWGSMWPSTDDLVGVSQADLLNRAIAVREQLIGMHRQLGAMIELLGGTVAQAVDASPELDEIDEAADAIIETVSGDDYARVSPLKKKPSRRSIEIGKVTRDQVVPRKESGKKRSFPRALKEAIVRDYLAAAPNVEAQAEILISYDVTTKQVSAWKQEMQSGSPRKKLPSRQPDTNEDRDK